MRDEGARQAEADNARLSSLRTCSDAFKEHRSIAVAEQLHIVLLSHLGDRCTISNGGAAAVIQSRSLLQGQDSTTRCKEESVQPRTAAVCVLTHRCLCGVDGDRLRVDEGVRGCGRHSVVIVLHPPLAGRHALWDAADGDIRGQSC